MCRNTRWQHRSGNGQILLNPGGVYDNTEVTVSAVADPGWFFAGWSGDLNGLTNRHYDE
ncbi:MAG: hypothetical protein R3C26_05845 [Calditrichia bacterium]